MEYRVAVTNPDGDGNDIKYLYEFEIELWEKPAEKPAKTHICVCRTCQKAMKPIENPPTAAKGTESPPERWSTVPSFRREEQEKKK
jgi:hypothetical protein